MIEKWLESLSPADGKTNLRYLAELIFLNGGSTEVRGVHSQPADNQFGRIGLTPTEAVHLMQMWAFAQGVLFGTRQPEDIIHEYIQREIVRVARNSDILIATSDEVRTFAK